MHFLYYASTTFFVLLCFLLSFVILIQESKGTGLGSSFGGDAGDSMFGTSTADVLKKFTATLVTIYFVVCVLMANWTSSIGT